MWINLTYRQLDPPNLNHNDRLWKQNSEKSNRNPQEVLIVVIINKIQLESFPP